MNVQIESSEIVPGQEGPTLHLVVSGFPFIGQLPGEETHNLIIPLVCIPDRKLRDAIPPCEQCRGAKRPTRWVLEDEQGDHTLRVSSALERLVEAAEEDEPEPPRVEISMCDCLDCDCCRESLRIVIHESYLCHNPDDHPTMDQGIARRLAQIGAIRGYHLDAKGKIVKRRLTLPDRPSLTGMTVS